MEYNQRVCQGKLGTDNATIKFTDGHLGLEDMTFPHWSVTIENKTKLFNDQVRYGRSFGQTWFMDTQSNRQIVFDWIDELAESR